MCVCLSINCVCVCVFVWKHLCSVYLCELRMICVYRQIHGQLHLWKPAHILYLNPKLFWHITQSAKLIVLLDISHSYILLYLVTKYRTRMYLFSKHFIFTLTPRHWHDGQWTIFKINGHLLARSLSTNGKWLLLVCTVIRNPKYYAVFCVYFVWNQNCLRMRTYKCTIVLLWQLTPPQLY